MLETKELEGRKTFLCRIFGHFILNIRQRPGGVTEPLNQGTITVSSPGMINVMTPPHMHINWLILSSVGA